MKNLVLKYTLSSLKIFSILYFYTLYHVELGEPPGATSPRFHTSLPAEEPAGVQNPDITQADLT